MVALSYKKTLVIVVVLAAIVLIGIKLIDENRLDSLSKDVRSTTLDSESTRLLFQYAQVIGSEDPNKLCDAIDFNTRRQMNKGYYLVTALKAYEDANLLADYAETSKEYYLSNVELWLYTTQSKNLCNKSNIVSVLFLYDTKTRCADCIVQGQILDKIRSECTNLRIISLAVDQDLDIINLIKSQYNVVSSPALVINNKITLNGLQSEADILSYLQCIKE
jgi:hypothetical protein